MKIYSFTTVTNGINDVHVFTHSREAQRGHKRAMKSGADTVGPIAIRTYRITRNDVINAFIDGLSRGGACVHYTPARSHTPTGGGNVSS